MTVSRRSLFHLAAASAAVGALPAALASPAAAASPLAPLPGLRSLRVGEATVLAVSDGHLDLDPAMLAGAEPAEVARLQAKSFMPGGPIRTAVNAYVVQTGGRTVLIDTGTADAFGPSLGKVAANLAAAGVAPETVEVVALTHLHPDHANGLVTAGGAAVFPNAEVVVHEAEWAFWTDPAAVGRASEGMKAFFAGAQKAVKPYADAGRVRRFTGEAAVVPGLTAVELFGHTPGHVGYRVSSGNEQLLVWGDVMHVQSLQLAHPDWAIAFDVDPAAAVATRRRALDMTAADRLAVAGMHLDFPGFGHVVKDGDGYAFVPARWFPGT